MLLLVVLGLCFAVQGSGEGAGEAGGAGDAGSAGDEDAGDESSSSASQ